MSARLKQFFGVPSAAIYCGLSKRQFGRYAEAVGLRVIPIGRSFFYLRADLDAFIAYRRENKVTLYRPGRRKRNA